jgi:hypothetical protein
MTTVREARIQCAMKAIEEKVTQGVLTYTQGTAMRRKAEVEIVAIAVVDALFSDHLLDNVVVSPAWEREEDD